MASVALRTGGINRPRVLQLQSTRVAKVRLRKQFGLPNEPQARDLNCATREQLDLEGKLDPAPQIGHLIAIEKAHATERFTQYSMALRQLRCIRSYWCITENACKCCLTLRQHCFMLSGQRLQGDTGCIGSISSTTSTLPYTMTARRHTGDQAPTADR